MNSNCIKGRYFAIAILLNHWSHFHMPPHPYAHPTSMFGKRMRHNLATPMVDHKKNGESTKLMVGGSHYHSLSKIWSDHQHCLQGGHTYYVTICHIPHCICPNFTKKNHPIFGEKERKWVYYKHLYSLCRFLCKVAINNDKFIHAPAYTLNEVMKLFDLVGVAEWVMSLVF